MDERWRKVRNLLVVRLDNLGDVLLATPAIHAVREHLRDARIVLHTSPRAAAVAELNPDLDGVVAYQAPWMDPERVLPHDIPREQAMIEQLRAEQFDAAIVFTSYRQSPLPAAYLCYLAGIPLRHAASSDGPGSLLTSRHVPASRPLHEVERGLDLVEALGFTTDLRDVVLQLSPTDPDRARSRLYALGADLDRPVAMIHPGCTCPARAYPWPLYADIADQLSAAGFTVVLTGSADERDLVERIRAHMTHPATSLAGDTSLRDLAATSAVADVVVTNNTGPMHVAAAIGTPLVVLFALTNPPHEWRPWQVPHRLLNVVTPCAPCYVRQCPFDNACVSRVPPATVAQTAIDLLTTVPSRPIRPTTQVGAT